MEKEFIVKFAKYFKKSVSIFFGKTKETRRCIIVEQVKMTKPNRVVVYVCYCTYYDYLDSRYAFRGGK